MEGRNIWLEAGKFIYAFLLGGMVFLFFCLFLDAFTWVFAGGWNTFMGPWPIFGGTVGVLIYGDWLPVLFLLICFGTICRIVLGKNIPSLLEFLLKPEEENIV